MCKLYDPPKGTMLTDMVVAKCLRANQQCVRIMQARALLLHGGDLDLDATARCSVAISEEAAR